MQVLEVIKLILNLNNNAGHLLTYDGLTQMLKSMEIIADPECTTCGKQKNQVFLKTAGTQS